MSYKKEFKFRNGDKVQDIVTGFAGTIAGTAYYLTGCNQYLLLPKAVKPHKKPAGHWFDEDRLEIIKEEVVKPEEVTGKRPGPEAPAPGGSRDY